jgi:3-hydroxy-9,10-secoandrosta-1,3,5(10)-triene-9,17-dione monooxygenase
VNDLAETGFDGSAFSMGSARAVRLIEAARDLQPVLRERAQKCRAQCKVPDETIADFHEAGFFKILQPGEYGGYEMDPQVFYAVGLELARACMSSSWVLGVVAVHNWQLNLFDSQASRDVWGGDPAVLISSSYAPMGRVSPVDGGYMLSGRWSFSSGSEHCQWVFLGAVVPTEDAPWDMRNFSTFLLPRSDYTIEKNWDVVGLQGTGSHDIVVDNKFVPTHRVHRMKEDHSGDKHRAKAPLYRLPFMQVFGRAVCNASLGAVEGMLDNYIEVGKTRIAGPVPMKNDPAARKVAAHAKSGIEQMKVMMFSHFDRLMEASRSGTSIPLLDRAYFRYETSTVADQCLAISSRMLKAAGSGAIRNNSEMLGRHQDILASQAHIANISEPYAINLGGMLFGQESTDQSL